MTPRSKRTAWAAWYESHDRSFAALRRAARTALVMPLVLFFGSTVLGNATVATFGAFGAFAMTLLAVIEGDRRQRFQGQLALACAGAAFICVGTLASQAPWSATLAMLVVGFVVLFTSVLSSTLTNVTTALLLSFILPVSLAAPASAVPSRLAGWALAGLGALVATALLWPAPRSEPLRTRALSACQALAAALHACSEPHDDLGLVSTTHTELHELERALDEAMAALQRQFTSTPYRPTSLSVESRVLLQLVDQLTWTNAVFGFWINADDQSRQAPSLESMRRAIVDVLEASAQLLADPQGDLGALRAFLERLEDQPLAYDQEFALLRSDQRARGEDEGRSALRRTIDASFRLQELAHGASQIGASTLLIVTAERRTWRARLLGQRPEGTSSTAAIARVRVASHATWSSVWLQNSIRGAVTLALATLVASEIGLQHAFWVVLGAMAVLRSNALATGQNALRAVIGTSVGFLVGGAIVLGLGTHDAALWALLPFAILLAGVAPAAVSFTAGQAAFTVLVIVMYNLISPVGWKVGALRIQDVGIGCLVSLVGGLAFWPRGASATLRRALGDAYVATASYLAAAIGFAASQAEPERARPRDLPDLGAASTALEAWIRLDDAFRTYLNERGTKILPLSEITSLVTGVTRLRLAGDVVVELWREPGPLSAAHASAVRHELVESAARLQAWFGQFAGSLSTTSTRLDPPIPGASLDRLLALLEPELRAHEHARWWSAVRVAWTADFLDAVAKMQAQLAATLTSERGDELDGRA